MNFCSPHSLPWDQRTPLGYFSELIFSYLYAASYLISNGTLFLLFISICLHHLAFYEIVQYSLDKLDQPDGNRNEQIKVFYDLIQFHILVKRSVDSVTFWNAFLKNTSDFEFFSLSNVHERIDLLELVLVLRLKNCIFSIHSCTSMLLHF